MPLSLYGLDHPDPTVSSVVFCKIRYYIAHVWSQIARTLTVVACIDRFVLTTNHPRFRCMNRPSTARYIIGIVFIFWHVVSIHVLVLTTINNGSCAPSSVYYIIYITYIMIVTGLIPPTSMIVFGYLAYRNISGLHARVQPVGNPANENRGNLTIHRRDRELFNIVLAGAVVYAATTLIYPFIIMEVAVTNYIGTSKSIQRIQIERFISTIASVLINSNTATPFYTYIATSTAFRKDFKELFSRGRAQTTVPSNMTTARREA